MKDLIKVAEEQIKTLKEIQFENVLGYSNSVEVSTEIRNWCEFIKSINENTRVFANEDLNWWKQENSSDKLSTQFYFNMNSSDVVSDNIPAGELKEKTAQEEQVQEQP